MYLLALLFSIGCEIGVLSWIEDKTCTSYNCNSIQMFLSTMNAGDESSKLVVHTHAFSTGGTVSHFPVLQSILYAQI